MRWNFYQEEEKKSNELENLFTNSLICDNADMRMRQGFSYARMGFGKICFNMSYLSKSK